MYIELKENEVRRYFEYYNKKRPYCREFYTAPIDIYDKKVCDFLYNGISFVVTKQEICQSQGIRDIVKEYERLSTAFSPSDLNNLLKRLRTCDHEYIDINELIERAVKKGYRLNQSEVFGRCKYSYRYVWHHNDKCYKMGVLDQAYSIIKCANRSKVYRIHKPEWLIIENENGLCGIPSEDVSFYHSPVRSLIPICTNKASLI